LTFAVLRDAARRAGLRLWSCPLNLATLAWLAIAAAWRKDDSFACWRSMARGETEERLVPLGQASRGHASAVSLFR
jgi:hypothetical protein